MTPELQAVLDRYHLARSRQIKAIVASDYIAAFGEIRAAREEARSLLGDTAGDEGPYRMRGMFLRDPEDDLRKMELMIAKADLVDDRGEGAPIDLVHVPLKFPNGGAETFYAELENGAISAAVEIPLLFGGLSEVRSRAQHYALHLLSDHLKQIEDNEVRRQLENYGAAHRLYYVRRSEAGAWRWLVKDERGIKFPATRPSFRNKLEIL